MKIANTIDIIKNILDNSRVKSFLWRTGMMILAVVINQIILFVSSSGMNAQTVVVVGLIFGEISKSINNALSNR